jgi:RNA polymerase sigma factor (sigma-70 family)
MINDKEHAGWIKKAQLGDKECLNRLAEMARVHLYEYVFRLTLEEDLTQDIVQECILEMFKIFNKLKKADRFWAWLEGIAFNKIRSHYGRQWRHKTVSLSKTGFEMAAEDSHMVVTDMVNRELKDIIFQSMLELEPRQRAILALRCYKDMPYSKIARLMGCTEFGAQSLFYRAKKALAKKLSSHGLGKGYLLAALVLFGKLTATTEAAAAKISVTAATVEVGTAASLAAMATSKTAVVSFATAAVIAGGAAAITLKADKVDKALYESEKLAPMSTSLPAGVSKGTEQCWYFFPEGAGGAVMMRLLKLSDSGKDFTCQYLQNQHANYSYDKGTIYIRNARMVNPDLSVQRLPTDNEALSRFIARIEGRQADLETVPNRRKGLLVISTRSGDDGDRVWRIDHHTNVLEEEYFQFAWPESVKRIDRRDKMHERGWTYFRIAGHRNGKQISGAGRIPFVYETSKMHTPWLKMQLGRSLTILDTGAEAWVIDESGKVSARYAGGSFFAGLGRPWMGLHAIDTVRRDAAEKQIGFETRLMPGGEKAKVVLTCDQVKLTYMIDMETDLVETITFLADNSIEGELRFSYIQDIDSVGHEFARPKVGSYRGSRQNPPGILWFSKLADGRW